MFNTSRSPIEPYVIPFFIFMGGLVLVAAVRAVGEHSDLLLWRKPEYWVYPLQAVACGAALIFYWRSYDFGAKGGWFIATIAGSIVLAIWISPQVLFEYPPRREGFDPTIFIQNPLLYRLTVVARFARLVIIVPLIEEIFWRGFLMRYLISEDFTKVRLGTFQPFSFFGVAGLFMLAHGIADWPAAFLCGIIYNGVVVHTKSLAACVLAHAITNLGLGIYIMSTSQWGFW